MNLFIYKPLVPIVAGVFQTIPQPVLGGATIIMFGTVAVAGIKIIAGVNLNKRASIILATSLATSLGLGLGVGAVPDILDQMPALLKSIFSSGISTGGLTALGLNRLLPGPRE